MTDTTSLQEQLEVIREAAQLLAQRYSMIGDALMEAAETFWSSIHNDDVGEWPEKLKTHVGEVAAEVVEDGDLSEHVEEVTSFAANSLISRILDLACGVVGSLADLVGRLARPGAGLVGQASPTTPAADRVEQVGDGGTDGHECSSLQQLPHGSHNSSSRVGIDYPKGSGPTHRPAGALTRSCSTDAHLEGTPGRAGRVGRPALPPEIGAL